MIANVKWCALGVPLVFMALVVSVDCSNSSIVGCPQHFDDFDANAACPSEGFVCPYADNEFDTSRSDTTADCFQSFIEYTCTQKKWTVTAQLASSPCTIDGTGVVSSGSSCSLGVGRCAVAASTLACQSTCDAGTTAYAATCVSGQFVVAPISCVPFDAGDQQDDAGTIDDAAADDDASDAGDN